MPCLGICLCVLGLMTCGAWSADQPDQNVQAKMSLADAVSMALDENPNLKKAEQSQSAARARLRVANIFSSYDLSTTAGMAHSPNSSDRSSQLLTQMTYANMRGTEVSLGLSPLATGTDRGSVGLAVRHPLSQGKGLFSDKAYALEGAKIGSTTEEKQYYLTRQATIQGVIESYFRAVEARDQVKVEESAVQIAQTAADGAREKANEMQITEIEVSRAEIRVAQTKDQLNIQKQSAQGALDQLMLAIGKGIGASPELTDTVPVVDSQLPTLAEAIDKALSNRAELSVYDLQIADQERSVAMSKDKLRPRLDVVAGFNSTSPDSGLIGKSLYDLGAFTAGLEYHVPMDKRSLVEDQNTAQSNLDVLRKLRLFQMDQVAESVRNAYRAVEASKVSVEILGQNVKVAQDNLALAQEMLDEGLDDNRNVLDGQDALTRAESGLLSAKVDLYLAAVNLKYAMGEDLATIGKL